ncbi:hypothetical protein COLO4_24034 [Corchorus olitorius]|uniref:Uncharacterized protein n=1 Tax=Corchorus olitorius TaxID=93759 RepID=A0A1R3IDE9_9ROSI|nr:hypothetical protein COLO4_24034 [Corchorus olitorius]
MALKLIYHPWENEEDYSYVLKEGPRFIGGYFLTVRKWEPNFRAAEATFSSVAVWVRLHGLPVGFFDLDVLKRIGQGIAPESTTTESVGKERQGSPFQEADPDLDESNGANEGVVGFKGITNGVLGAASLILEQPLCVPSLKGPREGEASKPTSHPSTNLGRTDPTDDDFSSPVPDGIGARYDGNLGPPLGYSRLEPATLDAIPQRFSLHVGAIEFLMDNSKLSAVTLSTSQSVKRFRVYARLDACTNVEEKPNFFAPYIC